MPCTYILAGCEGMVGLFEQRPDGQIALLPQGETSLFSSVTAMQDALSRAEASFKLGQLVIIGSASDIAWIHRCLPDTVSRHVAAEIEYPLVSGWFREGPEMKGLTHALQQLLRP